MYEILFYVHSDWDDTDMISRLSAPEADVARKNRQTHNIDVKNQGFGPLHASFTPVIMDQELIFQDVNAVLHWLWLRALTLSL